MSVDIDRRASEREEKEIKEGWGLKGGAMKKSLPQVSCLAFHRARHFVFVHAIRHFDDIEVSCPQPACWGNRIIRNPGYWPILRHLRYQITWVTN